MGKIKVKEGRPTVMTDDTIRKLEESFSIGASDKEACFQANIGMSTLYDYCQAHPDFSERKEQLKDMPKFQARKNIASEINKGNQSMSTWYLERKAKDEFAGRTENTGAGGKDLIPTEFTEEQKTKLLTLLDDTRGS